MPVCWAGGSDFMDPGIIHVGFDNITTSQSVRITVIDDSVLEDDENLFGNLTTADPAVIVHPTQAEATIIEDNDSTLWTNMLQVHNYYKLFGLPLADVTIGFQREDYSVYEFEGSVTLTVILIFGELDRSVQINFSVTSGTAVGMFPFSFPNPLASLYN